MMLISFTRISGDDPVPPRYENGLFTVLPAYAGMILKYIDIEKEKIRFTRIRGDDPGLEDYKKARQYLDWLIEELDEDIDVDRQMTYLEDEMKQELTPEEEKEMHDLTRKMLHTALTLTDEEKARHKELVEKGIGTDGDIREEKRQNRENFLKLQEKLSKKVIK